MVFFNNIHPTDHYLEEHQQEVPWDKVVEIILSTKNPRKKEGKFEIQGSGYYILFETRNNIAYVINTKKSR